MLYGAIEAGGTKFVCAVGTKDLEVIERIQIPTTTPIETMNNVIDFFKKHQEQLAAIGIGSFGPIDIHPNSATYGYITSTPKKAWQNFDFIGYLNKNLKELPIVFTTDVNAAAYGEYVAGNGKGRSTIVYYTIGTGIGGGALQNGTFVEGFSHPEMGHMLVRRHPVDTFKGVCPYHSDCLEGMASGPAIEQRTGMKGQELSVADPSWELEAYYIAQCVYNTTLLFSPDVIIFGGGVMKQAHLRERVQEALVGLMDHYVDYPAFENYVLPPKLGDDAGIIGCLALALEKSEKDIF
ncbi:TPA: ROK family protein [Enterococcus faecium]